MTDHAPRKPHNLSLDANLVKEAREHEINISRAAEEGINEALRKARADRWLEENREAIESSNRWVEEHGLPLSEYRQI